MNKKQNTGWSLTFKIPTNTIVAEMEYHIDLIEHLIKSSPRLRKAKVLLLPNKDDSSITIIFGDDISEESYPGSFETTCGSIGMYCKYFQREWEHPDD